MLKFVANLTYLFRELPLAERFQAAKDAGFDGFEVLFPYELPADELSRAITGTGLPLILINTPGATPETGFPGIAAKPGQEAQFREIFSQALSYASVLKPRFLHVMSGCAEGPAAKESFTGNLRWALTETRKRCPELTLTIEPVNTFDIPGYFLGSFELAEDILAEINNPSLALQFDAYHAHRMMGDAPALWRELAPHVRQVQVSDHPGRPEPGKGEIDFDQLFSALAETGYDGFVSGEYHPAGKTAEGLGWLARARGQR